MLVLGLVVVAPTTAVAQDGCLPAGGMDDDPPISQIQYHGDGDPEYDRTVASGSAEPFTETSHDVIFSGGGWGHGVGLSQFAAQGAANEFGCTHEQILQTHFPDTGLEERAPGRSQLRLKVFTTGGGGTPSVWAEEPITWQQCEQNDDASLVKGSCKAIAPDQPAGSTWTVRREGGAWRIQGQGIDETIGSDTHTVLRAHHNERLVRVKSDGGASAGAGLHVRYGVLELDYTSLNGGRLFATQIINNGNKHPQLSTIDTYLLGLAEVPFGWHEEALRTQVIAARSYAEALATLRQSGSEENRIRTLDCRCDLRVDTGDQVWAGATKEEVEPAYYPRWEQAVRDTANRYVVRGNGAVLQTFYSSSHGGWSRAGFNSDSSQYASVDVSRWEKASNNRRYRWSQGVSVAQLERAFGIDDIDGIEVTETDAGGYPLNVRVTGVDDGVEVTRDLDPYQQVRGALGLYGPRFHIHVVNDLANDDRIPVARVAGDDRIQTAIRLSADGWSEGSDTVVLARQDVAADALTGSALAGTHDAPLLLTEKDRLLSAVADEIQRLEATTVILLGGPSALSEQVERDIAALGIADIQRVQGPDRHATAADIASKVTRGDQTTAYLVRLAAPNPAVGWVDALSVAGVAARRAGGDAAWPVLGTDATLPEATRAAIADLGITRVVPVGGPNTIPASVVDELKALGVEVAGRLAGADRYGTSRAVAATDEPTAQSLVIATGENFPDGLAAGPYVARTGGTLLLVPRTADPAPLWEPEQHPAFIRSFGWDDPSLSAVGGPAAIENAVVSRVAVALESARPDS